MSVANSKTTVAVIDYGMGNLHSAAKALETVAPGANVIVTADADKILSADRVVYASQNAIVISPPKIYMDI